MNFSLGTQLQLTPEVLETHQENPIIRDFLLIRNQRSGTIPPEAPTPIEDFSSCLSESFLLSPVSELSLVNLLHPAAENTPESDCTPISMGRFLRVSPRNLRFAPISNTDSEESHFRRQNHEPLRGSSILTRYRRLMEDLEVLQGIQVASFSDSEFDYETEENSFTELMLAVDPHTTGVQSMDIVSWLADHFKRLKKPRNLSIDGLIMLHGVSLGFHNIGHRNRNLRWKPLRQLNVPKMKKSTNVFTRFFSYWRSPRKHQNRPIFLIRRLLRDRVSSFF